MKQTKQTRLSEFFRSDKNETQNPSPHPEIPQVKLQKPKSTTEERMWQKILTPHENWGVCNLDGTVLLVQLVDGHMHVHGEEVVCKWCEGILEIRDDKIFCNGQCKRYQGEFSRDPNDFLRWEGIKSYTLRKIVANAENMELEPRDLEPISYAPNWSVLYEYADEMISDEDLIDESD